MRGFTLIEMIVVLAIIVVITAVAVLGQSNFNRSLVLTDTTYTVAFSVREAQSLGFSSRVFNTVQNAGYGIHIDGDFPSRYQLFADTNPPGGNDMSGLCPTGHAASLGATDPDRKPGNCLYNISTELVQQYTLNRGFSFLRVCGHDSSDGSYRCSDDSQHSVDKIDITFTRPSTQAAIIATTESGNNFGMNDASIYVQSPDKAMKRCVYVSKLGQVSVLLGGETNCP